MTSCFLEQPQQDLELPWRSCCHCRCREGAHQDACQRSCRGVRARHALLKASGSPTQLKVSVKVWLLWVLNDQYTTFGSCWSFPVCSHTSLLSRSSQGASAFVSISGATIMLVRTRMDVLKKKETYRHCDKASVKKLAARACDLKSSPLEPVRGAKRVNTVASVGCGRFSRLRHAHQRTHCVSNRAFPDGRTEHCKAKGNNLLAPQLSQAQSFALKLTTSYKLKSFPFLRAVLVHLLPCCSFHRLSRR